MIKLTTFVFLTVLCASATLGQRTRTGGNAENRNRSGFCTEEVTVWQEGGWEVFNGKRYRAPAQWVRKKIEIPCNEVPESRRNNPDDNLYTVGTCTAPTLDPVSFQNALETIRKANFEASKLTVTRQVIQNNCMTCAQVLQLMKEFSFENSRLDIAKYAYDFTFDKNQYFHVNEGFQFDHSISQLEEYIKTKPAPGTPPPAQFQAFNGCPRPQIAENELKQLMEQIKNTTSDDTKLSVAKQGIDAYCISSEQVKRIASEFLRQSNRLDFAKYAYDFVYDRQNYIIVHDVLSSNVLKQDLSKYVLEKRQRR